MPKKEKQQTQEVDAAALAEVINTLSRLRSLVDGARLPAGEAKQNLITHLSLASIAAHSFRLRDDDIIVIDE